MKEIEIPEGYEARIEDNKIILKKKKIESKNELMRKELLAFAELHIYDFKKYKYSSDEKVQQIISWWRNIIAYLKKQKEQEPAEWSEEDARILYNVIAYVGYAAGQRGVRDDEFKEANSWLKSLRPQPHWKPSKKQMEALEDAFRKDGGNEYRKVINSLYCDLEKLL